MKKLTQRETKMLLLLSRGHSCSEIGQACGLTGGTTRVYLHNLYKKLNVKNKTHAAIWYIKKSEAA